MSTTTEPPIDPLRLPWLLYKQEAPRSLVVEDRQALENFVQRVGPVWEAAAELPEQYHRVSPDQSALAATLLGFLIFSPEARERDEELRAAFEACLHPEHRAAIMAEGTSTMVFHRVRSQFQDAADRGESLGAAMVNMLDVLLREGGRLRMAMAHSEPAVLWEDLLNAAGALPDDKSDQMLHEFAKEKFAAWIASQPYVRVDTLVWTVPRVVQELSRTPEQKRTIFRAGQHIFSALVHSRPDMLTMLKDVVKEEIEENGPNALQQANALQHQALGPNEPSGEPVLQVTESENGEIKVSKVKEVKH